MLKNKILEEIVQKNEKERFTCALGTITKINKISNSASVSLESTIDKKIELDDIPLPIYGRGIHTALPNVGDEVVVTFVGNSLLQAKIISVVDELYKYRTRYQEQHIKQGSYISNIDYSSIDDIDEDDIKALTDNWIDEENNYLLKYYSYAKSEPIKDLSRDISLLSYFDEGEVGLIHPTNKSIIKLKNDGCVDIFSEDNIGIRVNPKTKTISFIGDNIVSNSKNWNLEIDNVNINSKIFAVNSDTIVLNSNVLKLSDSDKKYTVKEIIKEL